MHINNVSFGLLAVQKIEDFKRKLEVKPPTKSI